MWIQSRTFLLFAAALCVLALAHVLAITFFLYWTYLWFDIPMHALGGAVVALGFLSVFTSYVRGTFRQGLYITLGAVLAVGILWEVFELVNHITLVGMDDIPDTILDLAMDLIGGFVGYVCARASIRGDERPFV